MFFFEKPFQVDARAHTFCVFVVSNVVLYLHWRREKRVKSTSVFTCGTAIAGATTRPAFVATLFFFTFNWSGRVRRDDDSFFIIYFYFSNKP